MSDFFLNPNLNIQELQETYQRQGYVLIRDWLKSDVADALQKAIVANDFWDVRIYDTRGARIVPGQALKDLGLTPEEFAKNPPQLLMEQARQGFAYLFFVRELQHLGFPVPQFGEWLHHEFLQFIHTITGKELGILTESLVTNYTPDSFLKGHSDSIGNRLLTYIAYFNPQWFADYSGNLHMVFNDTGRMETFVPGMNVLLLFDVTTQYHFVSKVADFATHNRYAMTGWILNPNPPEST